MATFVNNPFWNVSFSAYCLLFIALIAGPSCRAQPDSSGQAESPSSDTTGAVAAALERIVTGSTLDQHTAREATQQAARQYYEHTNYAPAWNVGEGLSPAAEALLETLRRADRHGLPPERYDPDGLAQHLERLDERADPSQVARLDVQLTLALLRYAHDLHTGRISPEAVDPHWTSDDDSLDLDGVMEQALAHDEVADVLDQLGPSHAAYARLQDALATYRTIAADGGWPRVPGDEVLGVGDTAAAVIALRERLRATGDLDDDAAERDSAFTPRVAAALAHFQQRHGLAVDSLLGEDARAALNVPVQERIQQIVLNMERWRWLPRDLGERYVIVNVPEFKLRAFEQDRTAAEMRVVVGRTYSDRNTPIFTDRMTHVIFQPYWNIPHSIAAEEIVPQARENLDYLEANNYEIISDYGPEAEVLPATEENLDAVAEDSLKMRQQGGPGNALGLVKFMFPNEFAVYLHDTPEDHLFDEVKRDFSHGCIRVEHPVDLAVFVLEANAGWTRTRIREAMHSGERQYVELNDDIPVYILYWTAFVDDDGTVQFREDLYGYDEALAEALPRDVLTASTSTEHAPPNP